MRLQNYRSKSWPWPTTRYFKAIPLIIFPTLSAAICCMADEGRINDSYTYATTFSCSIIIAILSPVAVAGNSLILAAIWRKTFQRTIFHILLSVLALTDLCTGLIAQPFTAAISLLFLVSDCNKPPIYKTIDANGDASATYFVASTAFITTLTRVERWFHMSRRSVVDSRRRCFILAVLPLIPHLSWIFLS